MLLTLRSSLNESAGEMTSPLVHAIRDVPWQVFGTFTFKNPLPVNREAEVLIRNTMRKACRMAHVHFLSAFFCTRGELGELSGRFHYHMLIGNFPAFAGASGFCLDLRNFWQRLREHRGSLVWMREGKLSPIQGDGAQVWPYDSTLDGVQYVMKGVERYEFAGEARDYELTKFGLSDRVTLSTALLAHVRREIRKERSVTVKTLRYGEHSGSGATMLDAAQFLQVGRTPGATQ